MLRHSLLKLERSSISRLKHLFRSFSLQRDSRFKKLTSGDVTFFEHILGPSNVLKDESNLESCNVDWMNKYRGHAPIVLCPKDVTEVSEILKYASSELIALVPQGGNTGLVGGSVPVHDEIILSLRRLDQIFEFDRFDGILKVGAGAILQNVDDYLKQYNYSFPLDLGAKGSCQIGGNIATNAGGLKYLRYGSMHANVLGLEVVLADGRILSQLSSVLKNNTGYNLNHLFIGSEGTLGIITAATVKCVPIFQSVNLVLLGTNSFEQLLELYGRAKQELGEILSAFEFMDSQSLQVVFKMHPEKSSPLSNSPLFYALIETRGSNSEHDRAKVDAFLENVSEQILDGIIAYDSSQQEKLWFLREGITESLGKLGKVYKYDLSIPLPQMYGIVNELRNRLSKHPETLVSGFGHLGDSNIHLNICDSSRSNEHLLEILEPFVYEYVSQHNGSISAEHGIGIAKSKYLPFSRSQLSIELMHKLKLSFDPQGILNPYKLLPRNA